MRSLDECQVAVRSHKADFLSRIERRECVELMLVARYFMSGSGIACFTFATSGEFFWLKSGKCRLVILTHREVPDVGIVING